MRLTKSQAAFLALGVDASTLKERQIRHRNACLKAWQTRRRKAAAIKAWETRRRNIQNATLAAMLSLYPPPTLKDDRTIFKSSKKQRTRVVTADRPARRIKLED